MQQSTAMQVAENRRQFDKMLELTAPQRRMFGPAGQYLQDNAAQGIETDVNWNLQNDPIYRQQQEEMQRQLNRRYAGMGRGASSDADNAMVRNMGGLMTDSYNRALSDLARRNSANDTYWQRNLSNAQIGSGAAQAAGQNAMQMGAQNAAAYGQQGSALAQIYGDQGANQQNFWNNMGAMGQGAMNNYMLYNAMQQPAQGPMMTSGYPGAGTYGVGSPMALGELSMDRYPQLDQMNRTGEILKYLDVMRYKRGMDAYTRKRNAELDAERNKQNALQRSVTQDSLQTKQNTRNALAQAYQAPMADRADQDAGMMGVSKNSPGHTRPGKRRARPVAAAGREPFEAETQGSKVLQFDENGELLQ
jgi:hypothetical protein